MTLREELVEIINRSLEAEVATLPETSSAEQVGLVINARFQSLAEGMKFLADRIESLEAR